MNARIKTYGYKLLILVVISAVCHYTWKYFYDNEIARKFATATEITVPIKISVGDPVTINIKGFVKYTDNHGLMVIEYKDSSGLPQQMVFHVPHTHDIIK